MDRCLENKTWTEAVKKNYLLTDESFDKYIKAFTLHATLQGKLTISTSGYMQYFVAWYKKTTGKGMGGKKIIRYKTNSVNNFIDWNQIDLKGKLQGNISLCAQSVLAIEKIKRDRSLSVNISKGVAKCHHCDSISIKEDIKSTVSISYKLPKQTWRNYTKLSDNIVKFCESRGIRQATLQEMGISEEVYYQPQANKKMNNIVFNYFEGDVLVNKKYRSAAKHFTQTSNTKPIFYNNINAALGQSEVYIVEGEFDVLAMHQTGIKNTISIPNGANDNDDF